MPFNKLFQGKARVPKGIRFGFFWGIFMLIFDLATEWGLGNSLEWKQLLWLTPLWLCAGLILGVVMQAAGYGAYDQSKN